MLAKRIKEKTQAKNLKEKKQVIFFGVKALKNSPNVEFFKQTWSIIIEEYWEENKVCEHFIKTFKSEYILKPVQWHYVAAFAGKSRTNNSLESGNNVIKNFFDRKSHNIKEFFGRMRNFINEYSTAEKTSFPLQISFLPKIKKDAEERAKEENFVFNEKTTTLLYYPRKGVTKEKLSLALERLL